MMNLSKVNRGLALTFIVLILVVVHLITLSAAQSTMLPEIKDICSRYIKTEISYTMLPEQYKKDNLEMPQAELNEYIARMTTDIKAFYTDNEQTYKYLVDQLTSGFTNEGEIIYSYTKEIVDYQKFDFEGDTVTVTILTNSSIDGLLSGKRESISNQTTDTIVLQKVGDIWKIVFANLQKPDNNKMDFNTIRRTF